MKRLLIVLTALAAITTGYAMSHNADACAANQYGRYCGP